MLEPADAMLCKGQCYYTIVKETAMNDYFQSGNIEF